jgi:hypothetical protein
MTIYFKVEANTETFQKMEEVFNRIKKCNEASFALAKELGAKDEGLLRPASYAAGGIAGFPMATMPENWRKADKNHYGYYFPKSLTINKDILSKIRALPTVARIEIGRAFGFESFLSYPGIVWGGKMYLVEVPVGGFAGNYKPMPDMVELTGSEFQKLKSEIDLESADSEKAK